MPDQSRRADPPAWILLLAFTGLAIGLAFPDVTRLHSSVAGNSGDSLLNLWIMRSVQTGLPHGWHAFWDARIFSPSLNTLGYSETLLPEALVHWALRPVVGDALAFNLIYLAAWVGCSWWTYLLARRFVVAWGAAFVAALAFTYSSVRLAHHGHFQLVVGGAFLPLVILLLLRLLDRPSPRLGIGLGFALAATVLTASYYGALLAVVIVVILAGRLLADRRWPNRAQLGALGIAAAIVLVLAGPIAVQYLRIQRDPTFRRAFDPGLAAKVGDFLAAPSPNHLAHWLPVIGDASSPTRDVEHRLFPGLFVLAFGVLGAYWLVRELRRRGWRAGRARDLVLLGVAGIVATILAFGDFIVVRGREYWLPFAALRHGVPGFAGIRAVSRFAIVGELALAVFAAVGLDRVLAHVGSPRRRLLALGALTAFVIVGAAAGIQFVRVPTAHDDGGVDIALRNARPGVVLELPIVPPALGGDVWAYTEAPRQLAAVRDGDPRVNGYSGFSPRGYGQRARTLDTFPSRAALAQARALGVRYVVLRTALVGEVTPARATKPLEADGIGRYSEATAEQMLHALPPDAVSHVEPVPGGYVVTLR